MAEDKVKLLNAWAKVITGIMLVALFGYMVFTQQTDADILIRVLTLIMAGNQIGQGVASASQHK